MSLANPITDQRMHSINSLRELVIILTGLTITTSIGISLRRLSHYFATSHATAYAAVWHDYLIRLTSDGWGCAARLALLVICVMRFHHGNIMLMDKSYVTNRDRVQRNIVFDFVSILAMSMGFAAMGFFIIDQLLFYSAYLAILVVSVVWSAYSTFRQSSETKEKRDNLAPHEFGAWLSEHYPEHSTQRNWLTVNVAALTLFLAIFFFDKDDWKGMILAAVIFINSGFDTFINYDEYFPHQPNKIKAARQIAGPAKTG